MFKTTPATIFKITGLTTTLEEEGVASRSQTPESRKAAKRPPIVSKSGAHSKKPSTHTPPKS
jgi:hypothetical protein